MEAPEKSLKKTNHFNKSLGIIIVTYGNENNLPELLLKVIQTKRAGDKIVVVDNHPNHGCADIAEKTTGVDIVLRSKNIGFAAACNLAARKILNDIGLLLFLNPDILPSKKAISILRDKANSDWSAWMGLLTLPNGKVNSAGNIVHISGLSWCDDYGKPAASVSQKTQVDILSGACLMIKKEAWEEVGGFAEEYFMYFEDADISMSLHQLGLKMGIVPSAHFEHDYIFDKGQTKWFYLERNRYIFILRQWPLAILIIMLPILVISEVGFWLLSIVQGRFWLRLKSVGSFLKIMPKVLKGRNTVQKHIVLTNAQFLHYLKPTLSSPLLGKIGRSKIINKSFSFYYKLATYIFQT